MNLEEIKCNHRSIYHSLHRFERSDRKRRRKNIIQKVNTVN